MVLVPTWVPPKVLIRGQLTPPGGPGVRGCHWNGCGVCRVQGRLLSGDSSVNNSATPLAAPPSLREPRKAMPHCGAGRPGQPSASLAI